MVEQVVINKAGEVANPSLEDEAKAKGVSIGDIDSTAQSQQADIRPDWLPEKFKSAEDMAKAYSELEGKLGSRQSDDNDDDGDVTDDDAGVDNSDSDDTANDDADVDNDDNPTNENYDKLKKDLDGKDVDYKDMSRRFWENEGKLETSDYETLEEAGYPRDLVDQFAQGQKALLEAQRATVFATAGGEQDYSSMQEWARTNFTPEEIADYDASVNSGNMTRTLSAVRNLKSRYQDDVGSEPKQTVSGQTGRGQASVYMSIAEMQRDMADPKYRSDSAFRARVAEKLGRSDIM